MTLSSFTIISFGLYLITSVYAMGVFGRKMYKITKSNSTSVKNVLDPNKIKLNKVQQQLLNRTSRYVSVLSVAILSTMMSFVVMCYFYVRQNEASFPFIRIVVPICVCMDTTCNMICLYLQYSFAEEYYHKYCRWCGYAWNYFFTTKTEREMLYVYRMKTMENAKKDRE
eukprot:67918_1